MYYINTKRKIYESTTSDQENCLVPDPAPLKQRHRKGTNHHHGYHCKWWDLVRAGGDYVFEEVPTLDASEAHKIYYPITQDMLSDDPELEQTDGYEQ